MLVSNNFETKGYHDFLNVGYLAVLFTFTKVSFTNQQDLRGSKYEYECMDLYRCRNIAFLSSSVLKF